MRNMIKSIDLRREKKKKTGCSWIQVKNYKVHILLAGDKLHSQKKLIIEKLNKLSEGKKK